MNIGIVPLLSTLLRLQEKLTDLMEILSGGLGNSPLYQMLQENLQFRYVLHLVLMTTVKGMELPLMIFRFSCVISILLILKKLAEDEIPDCPTWQAPSDGTTGVYPESAIYEVAFQW